MSFTLSRRLAAEALGTGLLVATVVGCGIMTAALTADVALQLLGNTLPTGAILIVLITILGPISGAHFNPAVSLVMALRRELAPREVAAYGLAQVLGGVAATVAAHAMFARRRARWPGAGARPPDLSRRLGGDGARQCAAGSMTRRSARSAGSTAGARARRSPP